MWCCFGVALQVEQTNVESKMLLDLLNVYPDLSNNLQFKEKEIRKVKTSTLFNSSTAYSKKMKHTVYTFVRLLLSEQLLLAADASVNQCNRLPTEPRLPPVTFHSFYISEHLKTFLDTTQFADSKKLSDLEGCVCFGNNKGSSVNGNGEAWIESLEITRG